MGNHQPANALWTRSPSEIEDEEYQEFYKNLTYDYDEPLTWTHNRRRTFTIYPAAIYPKKSAVWPVPTWAKTRSKTVRQTCIYCGWCRAVIADVSAFCQRVIDTADLPLNVSREILQESRDVKSIRDGNARRIRLC